MTHDYSRAIKYYEVTLRDDPKLVTFFTIKTLKH